MPIDPKALHEASALLEGETIWADECLFMTSIRSVCRALVTANDELTESRRLFRIAREALESICGNLLTCSIPKEHVDYWRARQMESKTAGGIAASALSRIAEPS